MRVIICGGRDYTDLIEATRILDVIHAQRPITEVISGGARGADRLGELWAQKKSIPCTIVPADWNTYGLKTGWIRNNAMADLNPDAVIAFPGGKGTDMMCRIARHRNIELIEV